MKDELFLGSFPGPAFRLDKLEADEGFPGFGYNATLVRQGGHFPTFELQVLVKDHLEVERLPLVDLGEVLDGNEEAELHDGQVGYL